MPHQPGPPDGGRPVAGGCGITSFSPTQASACHEANRFSPNLLVSRGENLDAKTLRGGRFYDHQECRYSFGDWYLQETAKERGISRTKLVQVVMEKVVRDELVPKIF